MENHMLLKSVLLDKCTMKICSGRNIFARFLFTIKQQKRLMDVRISYFRNILQKISPDFTYLRLQTNGSVKKGTVCVSTRFNIKIRDVFVTYRYNSR